MTLPTYIGLPVQLGVCAVTAPAAVDADKSRNFLTGTRLAFSLASRPVETLGILSIFMDSLTSQILQISYIH